MYNFMHTDPALSSLPPSTMAGGPQAWMRALTGGTIIIGLGVLLLKSK